MNRKFWKKWNKYRKMVVNQSGSKQLVLSHKEDFKARFILNTWIHVYINDLTEKNECKTKVFADDNKKYKIKVALVIILFSKTIFSMPTSVVEIGNIYSVQKSKVITLKLKKVYNTTILYQAKWRKTNNENY